MANFKRVQSGTASILIANTSATATIPIAINTGKSFLIFSVNGDTSSEIGGRGAISGYFSSTTQITFTRGMSGGNGNMQITWFVVEYQSGLSVQRGSSSNVGTVSNVTITAVTLAKSFAKCYTHGSNTVAYGGCQQILADLTTTTNLALKSTVASNTNTVRWEVIEHDSISVQKISGTIAAGDGGDDISISTVTSASTWTIGNVSNSGESGVVSEIPIWKLKSDILLRVQRQVSTNLAVYCIYVVSGMNVVVRRFGTETVLVAANTSVTVTIISINSTRSIAYSNSANNGYWNSSAQPTNRGYLVETRLNSSTQIGFYRQNTSSLDVETFFEAVEFHIPISSGFISFLRMFAS